MKTLTSRLRKRSPCDREDRLVACVCESPRIPRFLNLVACPHCDLLQRLPELMPGASARCPRCNKELWRHKQDSPNRTFALTVAATVLYVIANSVPMLGLTIVGRAASTTVFGGVETLWQDGQGIVAALVLFTAIIAPALQIGLMLAIVLGALRTPVPR